MRLSPVVLFVKTTMIGGLVFLAPVVVLGWLVYKAAGVLQRLAKPLAAVLPVDRLYGLLVADLIAIVMVILACFLAGLLARVSAANRFVTKAETGVLWRIPGYAFVRALTDSLDDRRAASALRPVLVRFDDYTQLAFQVEQLADGRRVVYVPSAPNPRAGAVLIVDQERVEPAPISFMAAARLLRSLGRGTGLSLAAHDGGVKESASHAG